MGRGIAGKRHGKWQPMTHADAFTAILALAALAFIAGWLFKIITDED